ncbi:MAG TPA: alpha/beta fold hydrolase [Nocardioides sp.]|nr:alpha/beta fold hydrolase [Nocardioides sp.]
MTDKHDTLSRHDRITTVTRGSLTFDVYDEGPADGEIVVLLHGFPERSSCWRLVAPQLHDAGYRTIAMDQRGYSRGARPKRRRDYRIDELVADAVALVDAAVGPRGRVHVVGHDWGAIVAWGIAQQHPDRVRTLTAASVPHPMAFLKAMARSGQVLKSWYMLAFQLPVVPELVVGRLGRVSDSRLAASGMTREDVDRVQREIVDDGALPGALGWYRALPLNRAGDLAKKVSVPTTLVWSDGDIAVSRWSAENSHRWVEGPYRFVELTGVSHWIPTQAPDELVEAILDRLASAPAS